MRTKIAATFIYLVVAMAAYGQQAADTTQSKNIWNKKFFWGITFTNGLVTIQGNALPQQYFWKPTMGIGVRTEYYFHRNFGVSAGFDLQQKGSGIITPDKIKTPGDPDSTHRARIKFDEFAVPIALIFRSNEVFKATRIHASIGITPTSVSRARYFFLDIEGGNHLIENHSDKYYKTDMPIAASLGFDFNAGNSCVFQLHFIGNWGTKNVYNQNAFPGSSGKNTLYGIRLGFLF